MNSEHLQRNCCSFGSMPEAGLTDSPLFLHPQHVQINTEAPCRSQRLAKYNTTTRQVALLVCGAEAMPAPFLAKTFLQMI